MERTDWPDSRIDKLEARMNGMPETVATHTAEIVEIRDDVRDLREDTHAIRKLLERESRAREQATESIRQLIESQTSKTESNKALKTTAFITGGLALLASLGSSLLLLVSNA